MIYSFRDYKACLSPQVLALTVYDVNKINSRLIKEKIPLIGLVMVLVVYFMCTVNHCLYCCYF